MELKYKRLLSNSTWTLLGNTGSKILAFILLPFYTRWLGTSGYGQADLITTYSTLLVGIMTLCAADGIMIFTKDKSQELQKKYFSAVFNFVTILFFLWALIFLVLCFFSDVIDLPLTFRNNVWLIYAMVYSVFLQNYTQQFVIGLDRIKLYSLTGLVLCISTFILSFIFIPKYGVNGYVWSIILSHIVTSCFCFLCSNSFRYLKFAFFEWSYIKDVLSYSVPLIPNSIMWWLVNALNRPLMENHLSMSEIGIYAVSNKFPSVISMIYSVLSVPLTVSIIEEFKNPSFLKFYSKIYHVLFFAITVASIVLMSFSKLVIRIFAAPEFHEAWLYMILLIVGAVYSCMSSYFGLPFTAAKKTKYFFYSSLWGAGCSILLNVCLIPSFGLYGACVAIISSFIVMTASRYIYGLKFVKPQLSIPIIEYSVILFVAAIVIIVINSILYRSIFIILLLLFLLFIERSNITIIINTLRKRF